MAMLAISVSSPGASSMTAQLQQQRAQRQADSAEQAAQALQQQAVQARREADQAQSRAATIEGRSEQANSYAEAARQSLQSARHAHPEQLNLHETTSKPVTYLNQLLSASVGVVTGDGSQKTGTLVNVTA